ncbi:MAG: ABC transporter substrate-binding protein [Bacteriovoracaceae bacterium]|nr:ABC transporter substrate-binding protein [Bacteriovoracaceae bacterium]
MKLSFLFGLLALGLLAFSCTKQKDMTTKELHLMSPSKIAGYDPIQASDMYQTLEIGKVYEGLFEFHPTKRPYQLHPNLAEGMPEISQDGLTYTFKIRKGVLFHDDKAFPNGKGREVKAQDFVYSFKRLADPKLMSKGWWLFDDKLAGVNEWREKYASAEKVNYDDVLEGIKAIDDYTLQIKLARPYPQLMYSLAMPYTVVVPKEAVEFYGTEFLNHPVGTGPFILPDFNQSNTITYYKNPNYREKFFPSEDPNLAKQRVPMLDSIVVHIMLEAQPRWFNFNKAKVDVLELPKDNFDQALNKDGTLASDLVSKGVQLDAEPMMDVTFYAFNHDDPLFKNNLKLRQAMSLAYDRKKSNELFYVNTGTIADGVIPPGLGGYDESYKNPYVEYNVEKAKQLLKEAGYPEGKGLPEITVQTTVSTDSRLMLEFFIKCMSDIGIKVKLGSNSWPELVNKVTKRQHQMYTMAWHGDYPDAENFLSLLYCPNQSPGSNGSNYCNPKFDALFKKATLLQDTPERSKLYAEINQMVSEDVPWILGFHRQKQYLSQGWIKNFEYTEYFQHLFQYLDVDLEKKKELSSKF